MLIVSLILNQMGIFFQELIQEKDRVYHLELLKVRHVSVTSLLMLKYTIRYIS